MAIKNKNQKIKVLARTWSNQNLGALLVGMKHGAAVEQLLWFLKNIKQNYHVAQQFQPGVYNQKH